MSTYIWLSTVCYVWMSRYCRCLNLAVHNRLFTDGCLIGLCITCFQYLAVYIWPSYSGFLHLIVYVWLPMSGRISGCLYIWLLISGVFPVASVLSVYVGLSISCFLNFSVYLWPSMSSFLDMALCVFPSISDCHCLAVYFSLVGYVSLSISGCISLAISILLYMLAVYILPLPFYLAVCFWSPIWLSFSGCVSSCFCLTVHLLSLLSMLDCPCLALFVRVRLSMSCWTYLKINIDNHTHT